MSFFRKLFGGNKSQEFRAVEAKVTAGWEAKASAGVGRGDSAANPDMIRVFDKYGREMFITKQQWRDNVLLGSMEQQKDKPEQLANMLIGAVQDGFAGDVIGFAELLHRSDPDASRGATILGIVYMEASRLDDARRVLEEFVRKHGEVGVVLTNLAKVYSRQGDRVVAEEILWRALEVDPNQENGFSWFYAIAKERGGEAGALAACGKVAGLPGSWRARVWLAEDALKRKDVAGALGLYAEAIAKTTRPVPTDLLMGMSGDLGSNGYLREVIEVVEPLFEPAVHGIAVGNNLMKAHLDLGELDAAKGILDRLYGQNRLDWRDTLAFWDNELAKARIALRPKSQMEQVSATILSVEGPIWSRDGSLFARMLPVKQSGATKVAVFGSTALLSEAPADGTIQLADMPGRLSRFVSLAMAEYLHLSTDAVGVAAVAWVQEQGFALFGKPYGDDVLCEIVGKGGNAPEFIATVVVDATQAAWEFQFALIRRADQVRVATMVVPVDVGNPAAGVLVLCERLKERLIQQSRVRAMATPEWYQWPKGLDASDYLLRLEQQLAVVCANMPQLKGGGLSGEHEIVNGALQLCVNQPENALVRMLLAQTLGQVGKARPEVVRLYKDKVEMLGNEHPIGGEAGELIGETIKKAMAV